MRRTMAFAAMAMLAACTGGGDPGNIPGDTGDSAPFAEIGPNDRLQFTGTEPFWGGEVTGGTLIYSTPETPDGHAFEVQRFPGRNGVSWTGTMDGREFTLAVTPGQCSDGMSDRTYPYFAMLDLGEEDREGCAWTDAKPYSGGEAASADDEASTEPADGEAWTAVRITGITCGDNCYVDYLTEAYGSGGSALCEADICRPWVEMQRLPEAARGRLAEIRMGAGTQYDGDGNVMSTDYPAIVALRWLE